MNCWSCSAEIPQDSAFCLKCGAKQNAVNLEEQIDLIEEKLSITNYSFSPKGRIDCQQWINEFGFDEVYESIEIALKQYLQFDEDGKPSKHSVNVVFNKISGICANRKISREKPYMADTLRMLGYANKKYRLSESQEKDYKEHISRVLYLLFAKNDNYSDSYESFFWKMKASEDKWEFLDEMKNIIITLEHGDKLI